VGTRAEDPGRESGQTALCPEKGWNERADLPAWKNPQSVAPRGSTAGG